MMMRMIVLFRSPPPCGVRGERSSLLRLGVGVHTSGADAATPLPDPPPQGGRERRGRRVSSGDAN
jgi:hypothetical protein